MKGFSERVPNKNIRLFAGKPLCYYILNTLENMEEIVTIIVNTDSRQIKEFAGQFSKVCLHDRPSELCGGHISMNTIIAYDLSHSDADFFLQTHATNPLLSSDTISQAIKKFFAIRPQYDSLFSACKLQTRLYDHHYNPINHDPMILKNTQDLDPIFIENSCIYLFSKTSFMQSKNRIGQKPYIFVMNQYESQDIDTEDDFVTAEKLFLTHEQSI